MKEEILNPIGKCRCCLTETDIDELRSIFKCGKICGQITKLAEMIKYTTNLEIFENDDLPGHICNKCVVHVSKAYAFKQQCIKADEELRKEQISVVQVPSEHVVFVNNVVSTDNMTDDQGYTYHLVEEYEDEERIEEEEDDNEYEDEKHETVEILIKPEEQVINDIETSEERETSSTTVGHQEVIQEEVFEYEIENEASDDVSNGATRGSDEEFDIIPKMVFRKYNKRNTKLPAPPFTCTVCEKILSNYSSFKYHMQLHSDKKPFLCSDCGESFKTRNAYDGHVKTHNENAMHKCNTCGKSYRQAASLRCHMLSHSGEKPFVCMHCGKGMTQKSGFKKHMLVHTGEKPHRCDFAGCSKYFRYSSNLIIHKRSHIGERKHQCEKCEKKFVGVEQLKRHMLIHSDQKPYSCDQCNKCFNRKSSLQVHQNTHFKYRKQKSSMGQIAITAAKTGQQQELIFGT